MDHERQMALAEVGLVAALACWLAALAFTYLI